MKSILCLIAIVATNLIFAQAPIVRQNGNTVKFYNNLVIAVNEANNGDTIYIPGGSWSLGSGLSLNKSIHIFGSGHHPDSSAVTGITNLTDAPLFLMPGCSNGSLWGVKLQSNFAIGVSADTIVNFSIRRCNFQASFDLGGCNFRSGLISENIFNGQVNANPSYTQNNLFANNFFGSLVINFSSGNVFKNNIFFSPGYPFGQYIQNCVFENNIFFPSPLTGCQGSSILCNTTNSTFNNNLFVDNISFPNGSNIGTNNIVNQSIVSIFTSQSGIQYNYAHSYQLQSSSPGNNAGTDGTDIGVYGGIFPWKNGSMPPNPHIQFKSIGSTTDQNGNLQINIKVKAQNN